MQAVSSRIAALASLIPPGEVVADIGTDHAYLPIFLIQTKKSPRVIATEIKEGPYQNAIKRVRGLELEDSIEVRFGDGLKVLEPGEAGVLVLAGIGGINIVKILEDRPEVAGAAKRLVVNPATDWGYVRKWLLQNVWEIKDEEMVYEKGKFYHIIAAEKGKYSFTDYDPVIMEIGPKLIEKKHFLLPRYLEKLRREYSQVYEGLKKGKKKNRELKLQEVERFLIEIEKIYDSIKG
ncbi:MAG: SAM-dependent methyltransferase [Clostridia bacterium]|nr:SAM-dependent methyltransferase [Clostridia bacterium]